MPKTKGGKSVGEFHGDSEVNEAIVGLNDTLCAYERVTGRGSTVVFVPHQADEKIIVLINGRPMPEDSGVTPPEAVSMALQRRHQSKVGDPDTAFLARPPALPPK